MMNNLGNSIGRYKNGGAQFAFWAMLVIIVFFIVFPFFVQIDDMGMKMFLIIIPTFIALDVYMYFKAKTEIDIREHGIYIRNVNKSHEILYDEIAEFDRAR